MIFPPAFLDSSSCWNTSHNQLQQIGSNIYITTTPPPAGPGDGGGNNNNQEGLMATAGGAGGGSCDGGGSGARDGGGSGVNSKPMSMSERARLMRVPQPEPGLNCPRRDSTNTKFCYFNNYSLTQARHFCHACHRYWTRGGTLRNVPVRRHAKRSAKPKASSAGAAGTASSASTAMTTPSTTACTTGTATVPPALQYSMFRSVPPHGRFADSFDPASLDLSFPARLLFADGGAYAADSGVHHHHQWNRNGMEQCAAAQMQSFPVLHAVDHHMAGPPAAVMPTTMAAMKGMLDLGLQSGGNGDDGGDHQFHHQATPPAKRDHHQRQQDYANSRGMHSGGGYNFYSSTSNAAGN